MLLSRLNQILILLAILLIVTPALLSIIPRVLIAASTSASSSLPLPTPLIELIQHLLRYPIQQLLGVDPQQAPGHIDGLENGAGLVGGLGDEGALELIEELEGELVLGREGFLAHDGFHGGGVAADGVFGVELVGDVAVVFARVAFADGGFHEPGEGGEDVDGGVDAFVVQLAVDEDLAFGDVACEIGDGVGDV